MAFKVIIESGSISLPKVVGFSAVEGIKRVVYKNWPAGALVPESEVDPDVIKKFDDGDPRLNRFLARVKSADEIDEDQDEQKSDDTDQKTSTEDAPPVVDPDPSTEVKNETPPSTDWASYTVEVLKERISGRGLTIPVDAKKQDLVKILEEDDKKDSNPFTV